MSRFQDVADKLPLKPVELELLLALAGEELHGYGLVQQIDAQTGGLIRLEPGNLYRVIKRLLEDGLVQEAGRRAIPEGEERRRYYRLTADGARVIDAELQRIRQLLDRAPARNAFSTSAATDA